MLATQTKDQTSRQGVRRTYVDNYEGYGQEDDQGDELVGESGIIYLDKVQNEQGWPTAPGGAKTAFMAPVKAAQAYDAGR